MRRLAICLTLALAAGPAVSQDRAELVAEGQALMQAFGAALKGELAAAMQRDGPVGAIEVCSVRAPAIAAEIPGDSGWTVARSSHRLRNPANAADGYTALVIADFLDRQSAGEPVDGMVRAEIVEEDGGRAFRMVKAIPTGQLCLACHGGPEVSTEVEARLADLYPEDRARGFEAGEIRGVFTLRKPLE